MAEVIALYGTSYGTMQSDDRNQTSVQCLSEDTIHYQVSDNQQGEGVPTMDLFYLLGKDSGFSSRAEDYLRSVWHREGEEKVRWHSAR